MKYIMYDVEIGEVKKKVPIIFPDILTHKDVNESISNLMVSNYGYIVNASSAGTYSPTTMSASGKSTTLNIESKPEDTMIIAMYDYYHGVTY